jgi:dihydrofolate synthase/folylpolyglutamate synthase
MSPPAQSSTPALQSYADACQFIDALNISSMKLDLSRMQRIMETFGNPQDQLPMVHIAGTNGKGSVTAMLSAILKAAGYSVGSFTSPHLIHVRERIALNGNPILPDDFQYEVASLKTHLERLQWPQAEWPTYFEALNIMAYRYFRRKNVDITVFETGLGGRLDSTNIVKQPNLTVITTIGMDHMAQLGNTLASIAAEKAGIIKHGVPLVIGPTLSPEALQVIEQRANAHEAPIFRSQTAQLQVSPALSSPGQGLYIENTETGQTYQLSLLAPYQRDNLATVLTSIDCLRQQGFHISEKAVQKGLSQTHWPVRFQYVEDQSLILDGSHNEQGFASLVESLLLYFPDRPMIWVLSLRGNREPEKLIDVIRQFPKTIGAIFTQSQPHDLYHRPEALANQLQATLPTPIHSVVTANPAEAWAALQALRDTHRDVNPLVVATGSLYTAGAILEQLQHPE